jgi:hypothetical protein
VIFVAARNRGWLRDHDLAIEDAEEASSPATMVLAASEFVAPIWPSLHGSTRATIRRPARAPRHDTDIFDIERVQTE